MPGKVLHHQGAGDSGPADIVQVVAQITAPCQGSLNQQMFMGITYHPDLFCCTLPHGLRLELGVATRGHKISVLLLPQRPAQQLARLLTGAGGNCAGIDDHNVRWGAKLHHTAAVGR